MSNGIGKNPLNDISEVYLKMRESYKIEPPKERLKTDRNMFNIPKDEQEAARERIKAKTAAKRAKMKEALDPVGKEDGDVNNDGKKDSTDSYLMKRRKAIAGAMKKRMSEASDPRDEALMKKFQALQKNVDQKKKLNIRGNDSAEQKARLEKKRGMKLDDHPQYKKEEVEQVDELYKGKHGQSDKEYAASRSQGGKMISGDDKRSGAEYTHGRRVKAANPGMQPDVGGKTKPKSQGKMDAGTRADLEYRKANLKKEDTSLGKSSASSEISEKMSPQEIQLQKEKN